MRPPFFQLDSNVSAIRSAGCGIMATAWLADWATDGNAIVNTRAGIDAAANKLLRLSGLAMDDFLRRGTTLDDVEQAYSGFRVPEYMPLVMRRFHGGSLRDDIIPLLKDGAAAWVAVRYGVLQDWKNNPLAGGFRDGHALAILAPVNGMMPVAESLRHEVVDIPTAVIEHAMEMFGSNPWGNGRGEAGVVMATQTWHEAYDTATAQLADAKAKLKKANAQVAKLTDAVALAEGKTRHAIDERDAARAAERLAETAVSELGAKLNTANARITELEAQLANPPDCQPLEDAARAEGRAAMRDLIVLTTSGLT